MMREGAPACLPSASFNRQRVKEEARELKTNNQFGVSCSRRFCRRPRIFLLPGATYSRNDGFQWCMDRKPIGLRTLSPAVPGVYPDCITTGGLRHFLASEMISPTSYPLHT